MESVVILVDNKLRDLDVAALAAYHLKNLGVVCHLEPLEAFRAVLEAYRPGLIVFNHMNASHQAAWSRRLAQMGVLTAVLPNEGISYDRDAQEYNAGKFHANSHIDYYFCWNESHRNALMKVRGGQTKIEVIGVPRFDFYFEPWSRVQRSAEPKISGRPRVLFCTNFSAAKFNDLPREHGDRLFSQWAGRIPLYKDYWSAIKAHGRARIRVLDYLDALIASDKYEVILRPHPTEDVKYYRDWYARLPKQFRPHVKLNIGTPIAPEILACDLEISCETCTTALESWIANKRTVEVIFERHPLWYWKHHATGNVECDNPARLCDVVEATLTNPVSAEKLESRKSILAQWCASPDGTSTARLARTIATALKNKEPSDWSALQFGDYRRAAKLIGYRALNQAYHFDPFLGLKCLVFGNRYSMKVNTYRKSIRPSDVRAARRRIESAELVPLAN